MNIARYETIENALEYYEFHKLYTYPIKCKNCNSYIKMSFGLFSCDCRHFILSFPVGIHIIRGG